MSYSCAVIGLGSMGLGMAQSLHRAGLETYGFDRDAERQSGFQSETGRAASLAGVAPIIDAAAIVVVNAAQTEAVLFGDDGLVPRMKEGSVIVACATVPPDFAREMERRCNDHGVQYLDAPISGGAVRAAKGDLSVMASGSQAAKEAAKPLLDGVASTVFDLGDSSGAGSAMKAVNQLLAGVHIATMAEALTFGLAQGVAPETFLNVISQCAGTSWMLENRAPHIVDGDYTPHSAVTIWPKDLGIVTEIANEKGLQTPITQAALAQFNAAVAMGLGAEDDAAVAKVYAKAANLKLPSKDTE